MKSKENLRYLAQIYCIIDREVLGNQPLFDIARKIADSGVDIVQFRDKVSQRSDILKAAQLLRQLFFQQRQLFILNDYLDIAKIIDSDGLHLGQQDTSTKRARKILGNQKIIGVSCHNLNQAVNAEREGADYISIGPIFATSTKPEYKPVGLGLIKRVRDRIKIPFFVIGGINEQNITEVAAQGVKRIAVCRAILESRNIFSTVRQFKTELS